MEELRSTDVLDKEIIDESRKKAEKLLGKAEETSQALLSGVDKKIADAQVASEQASEKRLALYKKNVNASLPLEKERYLVSYIHGSVIEAMNSYFANVSIEKRLGILQGLVERAKPCLGGNSVNALVISLDGEHSVTLKAAETMLKNTLGAAVASVQKGDASALQGESVGGFLHNEGIILKTTDGSVTCRLTLAEKVKELLEDKTYELAEALFGGRLPE